MISQNSKRFYIPQLDSLSRGSGFVQQGAERGRDAEVERVHPTDPGLWRNFGRQEVLLPTQLLAEQIQDSRRNGRWNLCFSVVTILKYYQLIWLFPFVLGFVSAVDANALRMIII
jgi:hypothetical protein